MAFRTYSHVLEHCPWPFEIVRVGDKDDDDDDDDTSFLESFEESFERACGRSRRRRRRHADEEDNKDDDDKDDETKTQTKILTEEERLTIHLRLRGETEPPVHIPPRPSFAQK